MTEIDAFYRHLVDEKSYKAVTAKHFVGDIKRMERWLETQHCPDRQGMAWSEVSETDLIRYLHHLAGHAAARAGERLPLPTRVRRVAQRLNIWFEYLQQKVGRREPNPVHAIIQPPRPKHRSLDLSPDERGRIVQMILTESRDHDRSRNWALISVMFHTDLFPSELALLREEHFRMLKGLPIQIVLPGMDPMRLPPAAAAALRQWLLERETMLAELALDPRQAAIWLVTAGQRRGQALHHTALSSLFHRYQQMAQRHQNLDLTVEFETRPARSTQREARVLTRPFYERRHTFMLELLSGSKTLWAGHSPGRAVVLQQASGRYLYGHGVYAPDAAFLDNLRRTYIRLQLQQEDLARALDLPPGGRRIRLPQWFDDVVTVEVQSLTHTVSERFRRENLIRHYQKIETDRSDTLLSLLAWLGSIPDEHLRVRKHFLNYNAHVTRAGSECATKVALTDFGMIVTSEVQLRAFEPVTRTERIDKVNLTPDFRLGHTDFYREARWEQAKSRLAQRRQT